MDISNILTNRPIHNLFNNNMFSEENVQLNAKFILDTIYNTIQKNKEKFDNELDEIYKKDESIEIPVKLLFNKYNKIGREEEYIFNIQDGTFKISFSNKKHISLKLDKILDIFGREIPKYKKEKLTNSNSYIEQEYILNSVLSNNTKVIQLYNNEIKKIADKSVITNIEPDVKYITLTHTEVFKDNKVELKNKLTKITEDNIYDIKEVDCKINNSDYFLLKVDYGKTILLEELLAYYISNINNAKIRKYIDEQTNGYLRNKLLLSYLSKYLLDNNFLFFAPVQKADESFLTKQDNTDFNGFDIVLLDKYSLLKKGYFNQIFLIKDTLLRYFAEYDDEVDEKAYKYKMLDDSNANISAKDVKEILKQFEETENTLSSYLYKTLQFLEEYKHNILDYKDGLLPEPNDMSFKFIVDSDFKFYTLFLLKDLIDDKNIISKNDLKDFVSIFKSTNYYVEFFKPIISDSRFINRINDKLNFKSIDNVKSLVSDVYFERLKLSSILKNNAYEISNYFLGVESVSTKKLPEKPYKTELIIAYENYNKYVKNNNGKVYDDVFVNEAIQAYERELEKIKEDEVTAAIYQDNLDEEAKRILEGEYERQKKDYEEKLKVYNHIKEENKKIKDVKRKFSDLYNYIHKTYKDYMSKIDIEQIAKEDKSFANSLFLYKYFFNISSNNNVKLNKYKSVLFISHKSKFKGNINFALKDEQLDGVKFLANNNNSGLLAHEVGFGKTTSAIAFLSHLRNIGAVDNVLISTPKQVHDKWVDEIDGKTSDKGIVFNYNVVKVDKINDKFIKKYIDVNKTYKIDYDYYSKLKKDLFENKGEIDVIRTFYSKIKELVFNDNFDVEYPGVNLFPKKINIRLLVAKLLGSSFSVTNEFSLANNELVLSSSLFMEYKEDKATKKFLNIIKKYELYYLIVDEIEAVKRIDKEKQPHERNLAQAKVVYLFDLLFYVVYFLDNVVGGSTKKRKIIDTYLFNIYVGLDLCANDNSLLSDVKKRINNNKRLFDISDNAPNIYICSPITYNLMNLFKSIGNVKLLDISNNLYSIKAEYSKNTIFVSTYDTLNKIGTGNNAISSGMISFDYDVREGFYQELTGLKVPYDFSFNLYENVLSSTLNTGIFDFYNANYGERLIAETEYNYTARYNMISSIQVNHINLYDVIVENAYNPLNINALNINSLVIDEVHNFNNIVSGIKNISNFLRETKLISPKSSDYRLPVKKATVNMRRLQPFFISNAIQTRNKKLGNTNNIITLSATPFTNNAVEMLSVFRMTDKSMLLKNNSLLLYDFLSKFISKTYEIDVDVSGNISVAPTIEEIKNDKVLNNYFDSSIDFKQISKSIDRPEKINFPVLGDNELDMISDDSVDSFVPKNEIQNIIFDKISRYIEGVIPFEVVKRFTRTEISDIYLDRAKEELRAERAKGKNTYSNDEIEEMALSPSTKSDLIDLGKTIDEVEFEKYSGKWSELTTYLLKGSKSKIKEEENDNTADDEAADVSSDIDLLEDETQLLLDDEYEISELQQIIETNLNNIRTIDNISDKYEMLKKLNMLITTVNVKDKEEFEEYLNSKKEIIAGELSLITRAMIEKGLITEEREKTFAVLSLSNKLTLSPYLIYDSMDEQSGFFLPLLNPESLVNFSPKFRFTYLALKSEIVSQLKWLNTKSKDLSEKFKKDVSSQIIYINNQKLKYKGKTFDLLLLFKAYILHNLRKDLPLEVKGFDTSLINDDLVGIITGSTDDKTLLNIRNKFNSGEIKVLIGTEKIREGIDLHENTTCIYKLTPSYNPIEQMQLEGRAWRQGNKWRFVKVYNVLTFDSSDGFYYAKLSNKISRIREMAKLGEVNTDNSLFKIDMNEIKMKLIKNPNIKADFRITLDKMEVEDKLMVSQTRLENLKTLLDRHDFYHNLLDYLSKIDYKPLNNGRNIDFDDKKSVTYVFEINKPAIDIFNKSFFKDDGAYYIDNDIFHFIYNKIFDNFDKVKNGEIEPLIDELRAYIDDKTTESEVEIKKYILDDINRKLKNFENSKSKYSKLKDYFTEQDIILNEIDDLYKKNEKLIKKLVSNKKISIDDFVAGIEAMDDFVTAKIKYENFFENADFGLDEEAINSIQNNYYNLKAEMKQAFKNTKTALMKVGKLGKALEKLKVPKSEQVEVMNKFISSIVFMNRYEKIGVSIQQGGVMKFYSDISSVIKSIDMIERTEEKYVDLKEILSKLNLFDYILLYFELRLFSELKFITHNYKIESFREAASYKREELEKEYENEEATYEQIKQTLEQIEKGIDIYIKKYTEELAEEKEKGLFYVEDKVKTVNKFNEELYKNY